MLLRPVCTSSVNMPLLVLASLFALNIWPAVSGGQSFLQILQNMNFENIFQPKNDYRRCYDEIEDLLVKGTDSDDIKANMEVLRKWINYYVKEINSDEPRSAQMLAALFQLEGLSDEDPVPCSLSTHETLVANDQATRQFLRKLKRGEQPKRRVDKIVYHYALKEARECQFHYTSEYELAGLHLTQKNYHRVVKFMGDLINMRINKNLPFKQHLGLTNKATDLLEESPMETSRFVETMRFRKSDPSELSLVHRLLAEFAKQAKDPMQRYLKRISLMYNQKPQLDVPQVKKMFKSYLVAPCQEFVEKLKEAYANNISLIKYVESNDDDTKEFYKHSALWHGCKRFLDDEAVFFSNFKRWMMKEAPIEWLTDNS